MAGKTQELEHEIAEMENRLATVKVKVEIEREAWKKSYRTGKNGTKWKSAARGHPSTAGGPGSKTGPGARSSSPPENTSERGERNSEASVTIMPSYWDALELAQYLQAKQLTAFAQIVIYEQITGQALLDTPPGKMRQLFQDVIATNTDPNWKLFLQITSKLHKLQKKLEKSSHEMLSGRSDPSADINSSKEADAGGDDKRRMKTAMPLRKPQGNGQQLATCWNCGSRFPRSQGSFRGGGGGDRGLSSSKALSTRTFCSKECQSAIENADISISSSVSASLQVCSARDPKEILSYPHAGVPCKSRSFQSKPVQHNKSTPESNTKASAVDGLSGFLHVAHKGPVDEAPRPPVASSSMSGKPSGAVIRKRIIGAGSSPSVASISSVRGDSSLLPGGNSIPPLILTSASNNSESSTRQQSKVFQQSKYRLDPDLFQANTLTLASCFYNSAGAPATVANGSSVFTRKNLMRLQEFVSVKTLHHLSLASKAWFEAIHHPSSSLADPLWGFHLLRTWQRSDADEQFLYEIGALSKPERPREMLRKLTRQVTRLVLENMKVLLNAENWHLATPMRAHPSATLQSVLRAAASSSSRASPGNSEGGRLSPPRAEMSPATISADMFEQIALIVNAKCEIVAVRAQELIRPVADDQMLTDILQGVRSGALSSIECRRLRLFSAANRLPFDGWHALPQCRVVFDFFWSAADTNPNDSPIPRVWHQKILERMQKSMQQRLLAKESVQQVLRAVHERNGPPHALIALEKFLMTCHAGANGAVSAHAPAKQKAKKERQYSPTAKLQ